MKVDSDVQFRQDFRSQKIYLFIEISHCRDFKFADPWFVLARLVDQIIHSMSQGAEFVLLNANFVFMIITLRFK